MRRATLLLLMVLLALTACVSDGDAPPVATAPATGLAEPKPAPTAPPTVAPTVAPTLERPDTPTPPAPSPTPTSAPSGFVPPPEGVPGFSDGLVLVPSDGSLVVYTPADGRVETLLGPGYYDLSGDMGLTPDVWPPRFSPDGRLMVAPRPAGDTWLIRRGPADDPAPLATVSQLHDLRLWFTWAPDSRRIVFSLAGLQAPEVSSGAVYVQDVVAGEEPRLLADLPPFAGWPLWSPGCAGAAAGGDCGRSIAVATADGGAVAIWLVDATTGAARQLGRFRPQPIDGHLWHRWAADGTGVIAQADGNQIFFPLEGAARPAVWELAAAPSNHGLSPGGQLFASLVYDAPGEQRMVIGNSVTGETVAASQLYEIAAIEGWTGDGRFALAWLNRPREEGQPAGLLAVDTAAWPAAQTATPLGIGMETNRLGLESAMIAQATVVETQPWATVGPALPAGPPETWSRREWAGVGLGLTVPPGWRAQPLDQYHFVVANYDVTAPGLLALGDEQFRADLYWTGYFGNEGPEFSVQALREMYYNKDVTEIEVGGVVGAMITERVTPVCATVMLPHAAAGNKGELTLTYCPATEQWRGLVMEFLAQLASSPDS